MVAIEIDGKIKTYNAIPKKWGKTHCYDTLPSDVHLADGFREPITPPYDPVTQRLGELYEDGVSGDIYYRVIDKTPEELEQEKIQKQKIEKEKIKQKIIEKYTEEQALLNPTENINYFDIWTAGTYAIGKKVQYKGKVFENTVEGNTNAPDKGGWTEKKSNEKEA